MSVQPLYIGGHIRRRTIIIIQIAVDFIVTGDFSIFHNIGMYSYLNCRAEFYTKFFLAKNVETRFKKCGGRRIHDIVMSRENFKSSRGVTNSV